MKHLFVITSWKLSERGGEELRVEWDGILLSRWHIPGYSGAFREYELEEADDFGYSYIRTLGERYLATYQVSANLHWLKHRASIAAHHAAAGGVLRGEAPP